MNLIFSIITGITVFIILVYIIINKQKYRRKFMLGVLIFSIIAQPFANHFYSYYEDKETARIEACVTVYDAPVIKKWTERKRYYRFGRSHRRTRRYALVQVGEVEKTFYLNKSRYENLSDTLTVYYADDSYALDLDDIIFDAVPIPMNMCISIIYSLMAGCFFYVLRKFYEIFREVNDI